MTDVQRWLNFKKKLTSLSISPPLLKKTSSGVNVPVETSLHYEKNTFTSKLALRIFREENTPKGTKKQVQTYHRKKNNQAFPVSPPSPHSPPPTCRITAKGRERHTTWLKESLSKGVEVCESRLGRLETDSRTPNFFSAICLIHTYFV